MPEVRPMPSPVNAFKKLFHADLLVQWRERRALFMNIILPVIFIIAWKSLINVVGAAGVLSICIAVGLPAIGLMAYSQTVARDRERGVFQRLRTTPVSAWTIMASRIAVQLIIILVMTIVTYIFAYYVDNIYVPFGNLLLLLLAALIGGMSFIALGQLVVGFVKGSDAVNSTVRLIYFPLVILGAIGTIGVFGSLVEKIVTWSPFGTMQTILAVAIHPSTANMNALWALLATIGYSVLFASVGIKWFKWSVN